MAIEIQKGYWQIPRGSIWSITGVDSLRFQADGAGAEGQGIRSADSLNARLVVLEDDGTAVPYDRYCGRQAESGNLDGAMLGSGRLAGCGRRSSRGGADDMYA